MGMIAGNHVPWLGNNGLTSHDERFDTETSGAISGFSGEGERSRAAISTVRQQSCRELSCDNNRMSYVGG